MKNNLRKAKGITLIALVITIIVLLILAGISISMIAGNNGILTRATDAKKANEQGGEKEIISLAKQEALIEGDNPSTGMSLSDLNTSLGKNLTSEQYQNNVSKVVDEVPIPRGFAYVEGTKKDTGLIVVDKYGNEFVWVPVRDTIDWSAPGVAPNDENGVTNNIDIDYGKMKTSVDTYGGFYVGRYETSWTGSKVASVGNVYPMNEDSADWYKFYTESKKLHNDSVVSSMIYYSQWDAIMTWMSDVENPNVDGAYYINISTGMGHYCYNEEYDLITEEAPIKTGSNDNYKVKNIYDLAGNMNEWTQRAGSEDGTRWCRGGGLLDDYNGFPAKSKYHDWPEAPYGCNGSRLSLYIK